MNTNSEDLSILLHISHGTGFDLKDGNIILIATLGGNSLETKPIQSSENIQFDNNLIWETNKMSIKKMKSENLPIKLECFLSSIHNGHEMRNLIGYILISLKGTPIVLSKKPQMNKPHSHKLIGLSSEWKIKKPEIFLFLSISDKILESTSNFNDHENMNSSKSPIISFSDTLGMLSSQKGLYIELLREEGLLQVGDKETSCDIFIVKFSFKNAKNLEYMINSEGNLDQLFRFSYSFLGTPAYSTLNFKGNGIFSIQENIAIHFKTSIQSLKEYFLKVFYIPVEIFYNNCIVAKALFTCNNILQIDNLSDFLEKYSSSENTFTYESTFPIKTILDLPPSVLTPYIEFVFSLKYLSTTKVSKCEVIVDKPQKAEYIDSNNVDDQNIEKQSINKEPSLIIVNNADEITSKNKLREAGSDLAFSFSQPTETYDDETIKNRKSFNSKRIIDADTSDEADIKTMINEKILNKNTKSVLKTFTFNLILETVKFNRRPYTGIWQISLHHQNADVAYTIANIELIDVSSDLIEFKNLVLQLFFSSSIDNIFDVISAEPCILKINGPKAIFAFAELDNELLLVHAKERPSGIILMENQTGEICAMANISFYIEDIGISFNSQIKKLSHNLQSPAYLDENLAYQMVEELEEWKQKQQEKFILDLKQKEVNHLETLSIEWRKRKTDLENELQNKIEQCTQLNETLEETHHVLKEKGLYHLEYEKLIEKTEKETEHKFTKIITELNEKIRRTEDDMIHKIKLEQLNYKELELEKSNIEKEKLLIQKALDELQKSYEEMQRNYIPKEQLIGLFQDMKILHERFEEVKKSQQFYKSQWKKVIRELHEIRIENLQHIENKGVFYQASDEFYNEDEQSNKINVVQEISSDDEESCESCCEYDR